MSVDKTKIANKIDLIDLFYCYIIRAEIKYIHAVFFKCCFACVHSMPNRWLEEVIRSDRGFSGIIRAGCRLNDDGIWFTRNLHYYIMENQKIIVLSTKCNKKFTERSFNSKITKMFLKKKKKKAEAFSQPYRKTFLFTKLIFMLMWWN